MSKKRIAIWSTVIVLVIASGVAIARADARGWHGCFGHRWGAPFGPMGFISHELNLNDTQRQQIQSMWQTEKPAISRLVHELAAEGKEMDEATAKGNLDEGKVQEIASRQGETIAKLLQALRAPLNILATAGCPTIRKLEQMGVARVSTGSGVMRATLGLTRRVAKELMELGTYTSMLDGAVTYAEVNEMLAREKS